MKEPLSVPIPSQETNQENDVHQPQTPETTQALESKNQIMQALGFLDAIDQLNPDAELYIPEPPKDHFLHVQSFTDPDTWQLPPGLVFEFVKVQSQTEKQYQLKTMDGEFLGMVVVRLDKRPMLDRVSVVDDGEFSAEWYTRKYLHKYGNMLTSNQTIETDGVNSGRLEAKTPTETQAIQELIDFVNRDRVKRGLAPRELTPWSFHKYTSERFGQVGGDKDAAADYLSDKQIIRYGNDNKISVLLHEAIHADSYQTAAEYVDLLYSGKYKYTTIRRVGVALNSLRKLRSYFGLINEALTEGRTHQLIHESGQEAFFTQSVDKINTRFDFEATTDIEHSDDLSVYLHEGSYQSARKALDKFITILIEHTPEQTENTDGRSLRETIYSEFIAAHASGDWKTIAKRIDRTLGSGNFAALGRASALGYNFDDSDRAFNHYIDLWQVYDHFVEQLTQADADGRDKMQIYQILKAAKITPAGLGLPEKMVTVIDEPPELVRQERRLPALDLNNPDVALASDLLDKVVGAGALEQFYRLRCQPERITGFWDNLAQWQKLIDLISQNSNRDPKEIQEIFRQAGLNPLFWPLSTEKLASLSSGSPAGEILSRALNSEGLLALQGLMSDPEKAFWDSFDRNNINETMVKNGLNVLLLRYTDKDGKINFGQQFLYDSSDPDVEPLRSLFAFYEEQIIQATGKNASKLFYEPDGVTSDEIVQAIAPSLSLDLQNPELRTRLFPIARHLFESNLYYYAPNLANFVVRYSKYINDGFWSVGVDNDGDNNEYGTDERQEWMPDWMEEDFKKLDVLERVFGRMLNITPPEYRDDLHRELRQAWVDADMDVLAIALDDAFGVGAYERIMTDLTTNPASLDSFLASVNLSEQLEAYERETRAARTQLESNQPEKAAASKVYGSWKKVKKLVKKVMGES